MVTRFYLYSLVKNLRFADPFLILFLLDEGLSYSRVGLLLGAQHLATVSIEFPSGIMADRWGRRRTLVLCFLCYVLSFTGFACTGWRPAVGLEAWLAGCLGLFAVGEALRTGSHKAIMLDYLDRAGQPELATQLLSRTRSVSKFSSAGAAFAGGLLLFFAGAYWPLFALSAVAAAVGMLLMLSYPRELEGDGFRRRTEPVEGPGGSPDSMWRRRGFWMLLLQSVVFESQAKILLKYFLQPFLKAGLGMLGIVMIAPAGVTGLARSGALWVGLNELIRDGCGGWGARCSSLLQHPRLTVVGALNRAYWIALAIVAGVACCSFDLRYGLLPGLALLVGLTALQNARRPLLVGALDQWMDKRQRASALSFESVVRALSVAAMLPILGFAADRYGLPIVFLSAAAMLLLGSAFRIEERTKDLGH